MTSLRSVAEAVVRQRDLATRPSAFGNACQAQSLHVALTVLLFLERVNLPETFDREIRLQRQQLVDIRLGFVAPSEVPERRNEWLVAVDEIGICFTGAPTHDYGPLIVTLEDVGDCIEMLEPRIVRIQRSKLAISLQSLEGNLWLADIRVSCSAQCPNKCQ